MSWVRATVGFLTFHLAFWLRTGGAAKAWFGVMIVASAGGTMLGNAVAPRLRERLREELLLVAGVVVAAGVLGRGRHRGERCRWPRS